MIKSFVCIGIIISTMNYYTIVPKQHDLNSCTYYTTKNNIWKLLSHKNTTICVFKIPKSATWKKVNLFNNNKIFQTNNTTLLCKKEITVDAILQLGLPMMSIDHASKYGYTDVLDWWLLQYQQNPSKTLVYSNVLDRASESNHVHVLQWWLDAHQKYGLSLKYSHWSLYFAIVNKYITILEWWGSSGLELKFPLKSIHIQDEQIVEWVNKHNIQLSSPKYTSYPTNNRLVLNWRECGL